MSIRKALSQSDSRYLTMFKEISSNGELLSHAFLLEEREAIADDLLNFLEGAGIKTKGNPDFWHRAFELFGIDEGRELRVLQTQGAFEGGRRIFIIQAKTITLEAQNALLKTFEEPTTGTHFFLIVPNHDLLLPTLRSRLVFIRGDVKRNSRERALAEEFVGTAPAKRMRLLEEIVEEKDRARARSFLDGLEVIYNKGDKTKEDIVDFLSTLIEFKGYISARGSSVKMILEHLALTAPRMTIK